MKYPNNRELTQLFISSFGEDPNFKLLESGIIVHFCYQEIEYNAYLKCISYAGKPYPLNVTRAQLPKRKEFKDIKKSAARFLFLGYDIINQVFVCWDPSKAKSRLNKKKYVSFFSRKNTQESVNLGEVRISKLSNGDAFAVFKKEDTGLFLQTIDSYFSFGETIVTDTSSPQEIIADKNHVEHNISAYDKIENDIEIEELIHQLWSSGSNRLAIIARCMNDYASRYPQMTFNSWKDFVYAHLADQNQEEIATSENDHKVNLKTNCERDDLTKNKEVVALEDSLFYIKAKGLVAVGRFSGDKFIVLKGSELSPTNAPSYSGSLKRNQLLQLMASHCNNKYILSRDVPFSSPSSAATFCLGRSADGWIEWKDQHGQKLDAYREGRNEQIGEADEKKSPRTYVISNDEENSSQSLHEAPTSLDGNKKVKDSRTVTYVFEDKPKEPEIHLRGYKQVPHENKQSITNSKSEVDKYIDEFIRMRTATKNGIKSPHKAVLLITILKLIGLRVYKTNHITFDDLLIIEFGRYWDKLVPKNSPFNKNVCHPFMHLSSDSFFHLNLKNRVTDINANWHIDSIREVCNYAYLDNDLFALALVEESKIKLINFLIGYFGLNNLSSPGSSSSSRPVTTINQRRIEPIKRASIKTSDNNMHCTPESFSRYLSSVKNKHGRPFSKSSISVYVAATRGDYMKDVLSRLTDTDDLYSLTDLNTLNRILDYLENVDFRGNSKTPLFALRFYIQFVKEKAQSKQDNPHAIKYWIKSNNIQDFRLDDWMQNHNEVPWRRTNNFEIGDIVFMYTSSPIRRLTYVFRVEALNVTPPAEMSNYWGDKRKAVLYSQYDLLKLIQRIPSDLKLGLDDLRRHGVNGNLQGGMNISGQLLDYILREMAPDSINSPAKPQSGLLQQNMNSEAGRQYWLFSWNEKDFLLHDYFRANQYIDWNNKHNNRLNVGDIVFLYSSHPESAIRYVTRVTRINVPVSESIDDHAYALTPYMPRTYKYCTRLKFIKRLRSPKLDFHNLQLNGLNCSIRSPLKANRELLNYILSVIGDID